MDKQIVINIESDNTEKLQWSLPFNNIQLPNNGTVFFYLLNTGIAPISIDCVSVSSTGFGNNIQLHSVLGEPIFHQEEEIKAANKNTGRNGVLPDIEVYACRGIEDLESIGQLDRIDLRQDRETYKMHPNVQVSPQSSIVLTAEAGELSGVVHISQESTGE